MTSGVGLDAREATAALRAGTTERLKVAFGRLVEVEAKEQAWDPRDAMISLAVFVDCSRRLGLDVAAILGPIAKTGPEWYRDTFDAFIQRTDWTLAEFGWTVVDTPDGPDYRFAWSTASQTGQAGSTRGRAQGGERSGW